MRFAVRPPAGAGLEKGCDVSIIKQHLRFFEKRDDCGYGGLLVEGSGGGLSHVPLDESCGVRDDSFHCWSCSVINAIPPLPLLFFPFILLCSSLFLLFSFFFIIFLSVLFFFLFFSSSFPPFPPFYSSCFASFFMCSFLFLLFSYFFTLFPPSLCSVFLSWLKPFHPGRCENLVSPLFSPPPPCSGG